MAHSGHTLRCLFARRSVVDQLDTTIMAFMLRVRGPMGLKRVNVPPDCTIGGLTELCLTAHGQSAGYSLGVGQMPSRPLADIGEASSPVSSCLKHMDLIILQSTGAAKAASAGSKSKRKKSQPKRRADTSGPVVHTLADVRRQRAGGQAQSKVATVASAGSIRGRSRTYDPDYMEEGPASDDSDDSDTETPEEKKIAAKRRRVEAEKFKSSFPEYGVPKKGIAGVEDIVRRLKGILEAEEQPAEGLRAAVQSQGDIEARLNACEKSSFSIEESEDSTLLTVTYKAIRRELSDVVAKLTEDDLTEVFALYCAGGTARVKSRKPSVTFILKQCAQYCPQLLWNLVHIHGQDLKAALGRHIDLGFEAAQSSIPQASEHNLNTV